MYKLIFRNFRTIPSTLQDVEHDVSSFNRFSMWITKSVSESRILPLNLKVNFKVKHPNMLCILCYAFEIMCIFKSWTMWKWLGLHSGSMFLFWFSVRNEIEMIDCSFKSINYNKVHQLIWNWFFSLKYAIMIWMWRECIHTNSKWKLSDSHLFLFLGEIVTKSR